MNIFLWFSISTRRCDENLKKSKTKRKFSYAFHIARVDWKLFWNPPNSSDFRPNPKFIYFLILSALTILARWFLRPGISYGTYDSGYKLKFTRENFIIIFRAKARMKWKKKLTLYYIIYKFVWFPTYIKTILL